MYMKSKFCWSKALAETIMKRYPHPDNYPYKSWCYPQGFLLWGIIRLWESTCDIKYYDYAMKFVEHHISPDGDLYRFKGNSMDDVMAGSVIVWAYRQTGLEKYKLACDKIRSLFDTYPRTSQGAFWHGKKTVGQFWVDGVFMGQMFLLRYGKYIGDSEYCFDEAVKQLALIENYCRKGNTGLLYHAWSEDRSPAWADPKTGLSPEVWSEGLGWYALILVEALEILPEDYPKRNQLVKQLNMLMKGLKNTQDSKTGLWYQVVDKGELSDNWHDTSGSAMFVYAIKKAKELGLAEDAIYGSVVDKGYEGIISKVKINDQGFVDIYDACDGLCVKSSYDEYINYPKKVNAKEAVAAFLWATGIIEKDQSD